jgi:hypothetical protein
MDTNNDFLLESLDDPILTQIIMITFQDSTAEHIISYQDYLNWYNERWFPYGITHFKIMHDPEWAATILQVNKNINAIMQKLIPMIFNRDKHINTDKCYPPLSYYYNNIQIAFVLGAKDIVLWESFTRLKCINIVSTSQISIEQLEIFAPTMRVLGLYIADDKYKQQWIELIGKFNQLVRLEINMLILDLPPTIKTLTQFGTCKVYNSYITTFPNWQNVTCLNLYYIERSVSLRNCVNVIKCSLKSVHVSDLELLEKLTHCRIIYSTIEGGLPLNLEELHMTNAFSIHPHHIRNLTKLRELSVYKMGETIQLSDIKNLTALKRINYDDNSTSDEIKASPIAILSTITNL